MVNKFTKGEWAVNAHYGCIHSGETLIARVANFSEVASTPETEANARLIAHAPEMYKLLKAVANYKPDTVWDVVFTAKELLARIDGKETKHE